MRPGTTLRACRMGNSQNPHFWLCWVPGHVQARLEDARHGQISILGFSALRGGNDSNSQCRSPESLMTRTDPERTDCIKNQLPSQDSETGTSLPSRKRRRRTSSHPATTVHTRLQMLSCGILHPSLALHCQQRLKELLLLKKLEHHLPCSPQQARRYRLERSLQALRVALY